MFRPVRAMSLCLLAPLLINNSAPADSWPQFRGADGSGVSHETDLPTRWSEVDGIAWTSELIGRANSSPVVTAHRVDVTSQDEKDRLWVISYDPTTGELLRQTSVGQGKLACPGAPNLYAHRHNAATPTIVADNDRIWAFFGTGLLVCLDGESHRLIWQRDLAMDYGAYDVTFGMASSPRMHGDRLYIQCITKGPSYVVALDKQTGNEVWKADRKLPAEHDGADAYSSPGWIETGSGPLLIVCGSDHVNAYDPATGKEQWISDGLKINSPYGRVIALPVATANHLLVTSGNPPGGGTGHVLALHVNPAGSVTQVWRIDESTPDSSSPVIVDGFAYLLSDNGILTRAELKTGNVSYRKRLTQGPYHASIVAGDGVIYLLNINGTCTVVQTDTEGTRVSENALPGTFYATPAISNRHIYFRSYSHLYCIDGR